jgi:PAS domain S-box-containing protein
MSTARTALDVLVVEDDESTAELERRALSRGGIRAHLVRGVPDALAALEGSQAFRAVLLDHGLPDGDPWRVVKAADAKEPRVPVIMVTATGSEKVAAEALQRGVFEYVKKADSFWDRLVEVVERAARAADAEAGLRRSDQLLNLIGNNASDMVCLADRDGRIQYISPSCEAILGFEQRDVLGRSLFDFVEPEDWSSTLVSQAAGTNVPHVSTTVRARHRDGHTVWLESNGAVRRHPVTREVEEVLSILRDVTERRAAEERLARSERTLRLTLDGAPIGMALVGLEGTFLRVNHALCTIVGYSAEELSRLKFQAITHPDDLGADVHLARELADGRIPSYRLAKRYVRKDHTLVDVMLHASVLRDEAQQPVCYIAQIEDITERKAAEAALRASEAALREALGDREVLLREVHHRVKNNLQVVSSLINLQSGKVPDDATRAALAEINGRVRAIARLHEKLYQSKDFERIDMTEYVRGLVSDLSRMYRSEGRDVKLIVHVDAIGLDLDVATPCGIILNELITNALKHAFAKWPEGGGEIRVSFKRTGGSFALTVADNGVGLPDLSALDHTTSLGWVLIRALGEQIGGQIHVDGSRGVSCTVVFPARG